MRKLVKTWHKIEGGDDVLASQFFVDEQGVKNGKCQTWRADGGLETVCTYENGKIVGSKSFYVNGEVVKEINYDFDGCPFIIKFFADEKTEDRVRALGLSENLEGLLFENMLLALEKVKQEKEKQQAVVEMEKMAEQMAKQNISRRINAPRVTFT
jgi:hypothetical protein